MLKISMICLTLFIVLVAVLGVIAPTDFKVEREIIINKPREVVFPYLKLVENSNKWNPWVRRDPNIKLTTKGIDGTVGFIGGWIGNKEVGEGEQEIKNIVEGNRIDIELRFKKPFEATNQAYLATEVVSAEQTKVKWGMSGINKFPISIICMVLGMQKMLVKDFDSGLADLKNNLEGSLVATPVK
ncbi:MAG: SRPBCC family protein [Bacteriovoracaceae bacterium]